MSKIKLPKRLRIGARWYDVEINKPRTDDRNAYGFIVYAESKIVIDGDVEQQKAEQTLLHEVIHGISHALELGMKEHNVQSLSEMLYLFLKDNDPWWYDD